MVKLMANLSLAERVVALKSRQEIEAHGNHVKTSECKLQENFIEA